MKSSVLILFLKGAIIFLQMFPKRTFNMTVELGPMILCKRKINGLRKLSPSLQRGFLRSKENAVLNNIVFTIVVINNIINPNMV